MNKIKTEELTGAALDWAVAKCEGEYLAGYKVEWRNNRANKYSTDWSQGGPIIERECIAIDFDGKVWTASHNERPICYSAKTPLIAAMRCYVASKMGDTVDIPAELLTN
jgi:hypothetical protein